MSDLFFFLAAPGVLLLCLFFVCSHICAKKGRGLSAKAKKDLRIIPLIMLGVLAFFCFFKDRDMIFDCRKETMLCTYSRTTIANKTVRTAGTYDFSGAQHAAIERRYHRRGRSGYRESYYKVIIPAANETIEIPYEFSFKEDAEEQAVKFSKFLQSNAPRYVYKDIHQEESEGLFFVIMLSAFTIMFSVIGLVSLFFNGSRE